MNSETLKPSASWRSSVAATLALLAALFVAGCASHQLQSNGATQHEHEPSRSPADSLPRAERVTFYAVPLRCPAAPEIGCGSRAKPVLLELERVPGINEAWLNRAGTIAAIVWADGVSGQTRKDTLQPVLDKRKVAATELKGRARQQALESFSSGSGWHRAAAVDRLSEEEAGIIAARFVRRVQAKTPLTEAKAEALRSGIAGVFKENFLRSPGTPRRSLEEEREAFLETATRYLNETELAALREAIAAGNRPLPGEK